MEAWERTTFYIGHISSPVIVSGRLLLLHLEIPVKVFASIAADTIMVSNKEYTVLSTESLKFSSGREMVQQVNKRDLGLGEEY